MNRFIKKYFPLFPVAAVLGAMIFSHGCANTTQAPTGGPKDTIPPVMNVAKIHPGQGAVGVPVRKCAVSFPFNEYVTVKERKNLYLSPPQEKAPKFKMKGKTLVVYFEDDLDSNRTYTLDITGAVADNNEGNFFPGYTLVFSTGERIDSMGVTGIVQSSTTLLPVKGATVLLYKDHSDSALFLRRPDAAAKTDDWGYFSIRNIQDTLYRVYAIRDENGNNKYDPESETVAFLDTLFRPTRVVVDTVYEFLKFDVKDTAACLARKTDLELNLFREKPSKQYIVNKVRVGDRTGYITFMAPNATIHRMRMKGFKKEQLITQFNVEKDSLEIWVNDPRPMPDTLFFQLMYEKTDSFGFFQPTNETVVLARDKKSKLAASKSSRRDLRHEDTIAVYTAKAEPEMVEQYGIPIEFKYPLVEDRFDSLVFRSVNPRQQESPFAYTVTKDSSNLRRYIVKPKEPFQQGYEYFLKVPHRKFKDINGFYNDSTEVKITLPNDEKLSTLHLTLSGVHSEYIVDLLNEKRNKVIRSFNTRSDGTLTFPYLKAGKYCIRITEDLNHNGIVDTGALLEHRQPEKVRFYKLNDNFLLDIPEKTEVEQEIDIEEMFL